MESALAPVLAPASSHGEPTAPTEGIMPSTAMAPAPTCGGGISTNEGSKDYFGPNSNNSMTMVPAPVDNSRDVVIGPTAAETEAASIKEDKVNSTAMGAVSEDATSEKNSGASNSKNSINSSTMAPAQGMDARAEDRGQDSSLKLSVLEKGKMINSNTTEGDNSTAMAVDSMGNLNLHPPNSNNSRTMAPLPAVGKAQEDDKSGKEDWHKVKPSKKKHKVKPSKKQQKKLTFKKTPREASKSGPMEADPQGIDKWHRWRQQAHQDSHYGHSSPGSHKEEKVFRR
jgi:hypothetical protein